MILEECREIGGCATGEAVITTAGNLPAKKVIHTVGPIWSGGNNNGPELLANAYHNCLSLADKNGLISIAFPNISTGIYGYPKEEAASIAIKSLKNYSDGETKIEVVYFVCFDDENLKIYQDLLK